MRRERRQIAALPLVALLIAGFVAPDVSSATEPNPTTNPAAQVGIDAGSGVPAVLATADLAAGPMPTEAGINRALRALLADQLLGPRLGVAVVDVLTGELVFGRDADRPLTPASTTKVLTAAAVLAAVGPDARLRTAVRWVPPPPAADSPLPADVPPTAEGAGSGEGTGPQEGTADRADGGSDEVGVEGPSEPVRLVLVGGGDALLSTLPPRSTDLPAYPRRASLGDLVEATVRELVDAGVDTVELDYDTALFPGPTASPTWPRSYTTDVVAPVSPLAVDQGRVRPDSDLRVAEPAESAARLFARGLEAAGIRVRGEPEPGGAGPRTATLAEVTSEPIAALVEHMLVVSDNDLAEALARQVAIARGVPATFGDAAAAVLAELADLGIDVGGVTLYDGSGLSRENRIPPAVVARTLALAATGPRTELRPLVAGLAIAGTNGTLEDRFGSSAAQAARGVVRGKSGYLTGVVSLAGLVVDADGRLLSFDVVTDQVGPGLGLAVRSVLDRVAGALASCGCGAAEPTAGIPSPAGSPVG